MNGNLFFAKEKIKVNILYFIIVLFLIFFYSPVYNSSFIYVGDYQISKFKSTDLFAAFLNRVNVEPLTNLSFYLNFITDPLNTFELHLTNIFLHVINTVLCYILFCFLPITNEKKKEKYFDVNAVAFWGSLLFCLLPVNSNAISWIYSRNQLLLCTFCLLSIISYLRYRNSGSTKYYFYSIILLILGCLCCRNCYYVFVFYFLIEFVQKGKFTKLSILQLLIFTLICLFSFLYYERNEFYSDQTLNFSDSFQQFVAGLRSILLPLNVDFYTPAASGFQPIFTACIGLIILMPFILFFLFRNHKFSTFIIAWLTFLLLVPLTHIFVDKTLSHNFNSLYYIISIIFCYLFVVSISVVAEKQSYHKFITPLLCFSILSYYLIIGLRIFSPYGNELKLWDYTLNKYPNDSTVLNLRLHSIMEHKTAIYSEFTNIPNIHFFNTLNNLGVIHGNKPVYSVYKFINRGVEPIIIKRIVTGCGCTTSDWTYVPILPNKTGVINVKFDPTGKSGVVDKTVLVYLNQSSQYITLRFSAVIN